jgi:hypothetical protein
MLRSWLDFDQIKEFCPSRQFFVKHARSIAIGVAALALWAAFPILTIPVFGIALPLYAGWLLVRSMMEDQRAASKRARMVRAAMVVLRQAIEEKKIVPLPIRTRDKSVDRVVRIVRVDERGVEAVDPIRRISNTYSWTGIDVEKLCQSFSLTEIGPNGEEFSPPANGGGSVVRWIDRAMPGSDDLAVESPWRRILGAAAAFLKTLRGGGD